MNKIEIVKKLKMIQELADECLRLVSSDQKSAEKKNSDKISTLKKHSLDKSIIDYSIPIRPFVKKYATNMSGSKKFTLILAHLSGGDLDKKISLTEIEKVWTNMTAILGMKFNRYYSQNAKDSDWVISVNNGAYSLRPSWVEIFS